jgi:hypothetical protein
MTTSNQYKPRLVERPNGDRIVEFYDGEDLIFKTTEIPSDFSILADMIHSTLEVAISFGFVTRPTEPQA